MFIFMLLVGLIVIFWSLFFTLKVSFPLKREMIMLIISGTLIILLTTFHKIYQIKDQLTSIQTQNHILTKKFKIERAEKIEYLQRVLATNRTLLNTLELRKIKVTKNQIKEENKAIIRVLKVEAEN